MTLWNIFLQVRFVLALGRSFPRFGLVYRWRQKIVVFVLHLQPVAFGVNLTHLLDILAYMLLQLRYPGAVHLLTLMFMCHIAAYFSPASVSSLGCKG